MLILRLGKGVIDHFPVRRSEWIGSCVMILWGAILLLDGKPLYGSWVNLGLSLSETSWASMCIFLGTMRLIVLGVNGTFPQSWYGPYSAHMRVAMSLFCTLIWLQLLLAGIKAETWTTAVAAYAGYFVSDALNTLSSAAEAREVDKGRKNVAARTTDTGEPVSYGSNRNWLGHRISNRLRQEKPDGSDTD